MVLNIMNNYLFQRKLNLCRAIQVILNLQIKLDSPYLDYCYNTTILFCMSFNCIYQLWAKLIYIIIITQLSIKMFPELPKKKIL